MNLSKLKVLLKLGTLNLFRVLIYRLSIKIGLNPVKRIKANLKSGVFFRDYVGSFVCHEFDTTWLTGQFYFGNIHKDNEGIPKWHSNCINGVDINVPTSPWYLIPDFDSELGDIKGVWEASRFDWVITFSQSIKSGDCASTKKINLWLLDWVKNNPPYQGANWKCGQEASIRVMHLALAAQLLGQVTKTQPALLSLIKAHLKRISPTIMYAIAQDNNHGTSEAAALFIGGSWLLLNGDRDGLHYQNLGRKWLENRSQKLISDDGSFSQYSVNYHRVMLDAYCLAEFWRSDFNFPAFSEMLYTKLQKATLWLFTWVEPSGGDAPNLGANDGAKLMPLTKTDYRDFRPSIQLAAALFFNKSAYIQHGSYDGVLSWLEIDKYKEILLNTDSKDFSYGGFAYLKKNNAYLLLRYPNFKFRPSQCDSLHVDLWVSGQNLLRDGGTYSYNAGDKYIDYYSGARGHNTIEFDQHEQMPRLSKFLLGDWLSYKSKSEIRKVNDAVTFSASYQDRFKCSHKRELILETGKLVIIDEIDGFKDSAILRWRLHPSEWHLEGSTLKSKLASMSIDADMPIERMEIVSGYESRYYFKETQVPVLEIEVKKTGTIKTLVHF
jgi:hypothetical protein